MEYEIDDLEGLFDASTNPSLLLRYRVTRKAVRVERPRETPRRRQALAIPEEEGRQA